MKAACWRTLALCAVLVLPGGSLPLWLNRGQACDRRDENEWAPAFQTNIERSGLAGEKGLVRLAADLRTGALSLPTPHVYALVGGGEWGPRVVAKALVESVHVSWEDVFVVDMEEAVSVQRYRGTEQAQMWLKGKVAAAIERCPRKALVLFDNVHLLNGEDLLLLDPLLLLFDDSLSHMEHGGSKVSGEGSLFVLLLNEEDSEETAGVEGKDRLRHKWKYKGPGFTTDAFLGRIDGVVALSSAPPLSSAEQSAIEHVWREAAAGQGSAGGGDGNRPKGLGGSITTALEGAHPATLQAWGATAAAILATGAAACWAMGGFGEAPRPARVGQQPPTMATSSGESTGNSGGGGSGSGARGDGGRSSRVTKVRGGGVKGAAVNGQVGGCGADGGPSGASASDGEEGKRENGAPVAIGTTRATRGIGKPPSAAATYTCDRIPGGGGGDGDYGGQAQATGPSASRVKSKRSRSRSKPRRESAASGVASGGPSTRSRRSSTGSARDTKNT